MHPRLACVVLFEISSVVAVSKKKTDKLSRQTENDNRPNGTSGNVRLL